MRDNKKWDTHKIAGKYWGKPRPQNVEKQIERFWKKENQEKRKIIYEYIQLERIIAEYGKL